jgi:hypothetical protein
MPVAPFTSPRRNHGVPINLGPNLFTPPPSKAHSATQLSSSLSSLAQRRIDRPDGKRALSSIGDLLRKASAPLSARRGPEIEGTLKGVTERLASLYEWHLKELENITQKQRQLEEVTENLRRLREESLR